MAVLFEKKAVAAAPPARVELREGDAVFVSRAGTFLYRRPVETIVAAALDEIAPALARVAAAVAGGFHAAGFLAYEAAPAFDAAFACHPPGALPLLWFGIYENRNETALHFPENGHTVGDWTPLLSKVEYRRNVATIRDLIAAGDTYQVNYTFPLVAHFEGSTLSWFHELCGNQRANYCACINAGRYRVLSVSPERLFTLDQDRLTAQPMKGTHRRGRWPEEDRRFAGALAASQKDRAENVMIVDLLRNDLGRVSEIGSVQVKRLFEIERYPTVWQMTSTITSRTPPRRAGVPEILGALFPSGSVTGAPKIRAMQIIRDLEPHPRGVYCGSVGWWSPEGRAEFNVAIRTITVDASRNTATLNVGGGITWDSSAAAEYDECLAKGAFAMTRRPAFSLIETLRYDGNFFLLERHLERLRASADYFDYPCDAEAIVSGLRSLSWMQTENGLRQPCRVRVLLHRDGRFEIEGSPLTSAAPRSVGFAHHPMHSEDVFLFHKTTHRATYDTARASRPECDDVLLWNERDEVTESTMANVVVELDGTRLTPPIACGLLGGTFRAELLARRAIEERVLTKGDVRRASRRWLINSVREWMPVELLE
jgi:para-aminobenzoate synthetase/4-amino-4-deoxychorismate lyase